MNQSKDEEQRRVDLLVRLRELEERQRQEQAQGDEQHRNLEEDEMTVLLDIEGDLMPEDAPGFFDTDDGDALGESKRGRREEEGNKRKERKNEKKEEMRRKVEDEAGSDRESDNDAR